ncbi:hypothetical protein [Silvibacterium sp.]|uniref:hypothetical protein n=1 Tax=Silvibacterium sp. TaxID=1964179 RepID=UPI0039E45008
MLLSIAAFSLKTFVIVITAVIFALFLLATVAFLIISLLPSPTARDFWNWMRRKGFIGRDV